MTLFFSKCLNVQKIVIKSLGFEDYAGTGLEQNVIYVST